MNFTSQHFRLGLAWVFFALSLMVVIPAPKIPLWYLVILATEYGHWFALVLATLLAWEVLCHRQQSGWLLLGLCLISLGLFLKPLVQASFIARSLPQKLTLGLGPAGSWAHLPTAPLSFARLWTGVSLPPIKEEAFTFPAEDGSNLKLLYYRDESPGPLPCIIMIHGGGWNSGDERQLATWNRILAAAGYRVASISYRLAPQFHWPAQKHDVIAALAFLKSHARELDLDPTRFVLQGRSAGGQIALATAYALHDPAIRGCLASYAPTDMVYAYATSGENDILHSRPLLRAFLGGPPQDKPDIYRDASPIELIDQQTPPTLLIHGTRDELVSVQHSVRLQDRLKVKDRPVFFLELPWATHGFDVNASGPGGQLELYAMLWFLNTVLKPPS